MTEKKRVASPLILGHKNDIEMQEFAKKEHLLKILLIGDTVGKTSIVKRYVHNTFSRNTRFTVSFLRQHIPLMLC